jgi:cell division protein FtsW
MLAGIVLVAGASPAVAERIGLDPYHFVYRHLFFLIPALSALIGVSIMEPRGIWRVASLVLLVFAFLTALTPLVGTEIKGAHRWIHLFGLSIQPSEFLKPAFAVTAAWLIARQNQNPGFPGLQAATAVFTGLLGLLLMQPDLGMSGVLSAIWAVEIFLSGLSLFWVFGLALGGALALSAAYFWFPHVASRIDRFFDPAAGDNYQVEQSLQAFGQGGLFGTGPGHGEIKLRLPDAHADFIFAVAGEELGLIAALLLVGVFIFILLRGTARAGASGNLFAYLATAGLLTQFTLQGLIHMGSSLNLLPAKGMTLPFISYGGSSMIALGLGFGMMLGLTRKIMSPGAALDDRKFGTKMKKNLLAGGSA